MTRRKNLWASPSSAAGLAALAALLTLVCALSVSCGRSRPPATPDSIRAAGAPPAAPRAGRASTAPTIPLSDVLAQIDSYQLPKGVNAARFTALKAELKRLLTERVSSEQRSGESDGKHISIPPAGDLNAVTDLTSSLNPSGTQATLKWTEVLPGDYNNDGVVNIRDLFLVAVYYDQDVTTGPDDGHKLVNGDADPAINILDLGAVAANYDARIAGYQVWRGHWNGSSADWEATFLPNTGDPAQTAYSVDRPSPPPVSTRPSYTYADDITGVSDKSNVRYKVVACGDGGAGAEGNGPPPWEKLITKLYIQVNGVAAGETGSPGAASFEANSHPTFVLHQVDEFDPATSLTTTRDATDDEKADTTWRCMDPSVVTFAPPATGDQTSFVVTPDWPASATVTADYFPSRYTPIGQTHVTAACNVTVVEDPLAAAIYDFSPRWATIMFPPPHLMYVKNYDMTTIPPGEVGTMTQELRLEPAPGNPITTTYTFALDTNPNPGPMKFKARTLSSPDPMWANATHMLIINVPNVLIMPGDYRWRLYNNLGKGSPVIYSHPSSANEPPYDDTVVPPVVTPPGTIYHMAGLESIPSVTFPWHEVWNDNPEVWIYPADPIIRKDGDTDPGGTPINPAWFNVWIKGQNQNGTMINGREWTITPDIPADPPLPPILASPTGYWSPGQLFMPMMLKYPWALVADRSNLVGGVSGNNYQYHIIGFGGVQEISTGQVGAYSLPGPGAGFPYLHDFGYQVWGADGLSTWPDWSKKTVHLFDEPTIVCAGKGFIPCSLPGQNALVTLTSDPSGLNEVYYLPAKVAKPDDPYVPYTSNPDSQSWLMFTLRVEWGIVPGVYYVKIKDRLSGYQHDSTTPVTPLVITP